VLLAVDIIWLMKSDRENARERARIDGEMTSLKAKLFDLQEAAKKPLPPSRPESSI
jgi:hypothetical protein